MKTSNAATTGRIPCLDLKRQHRKIKTEIFREFEKVYEDTAFSGGLFTDEFEKKFASYCGTRYAVAVNSGTSALHLAMVISGIGPGDEVIVPANTFIATAWAVSYVGATPVFIDCREDTWEIDGEIVEERITAKTKAIIGVHLYGQPFDVDSITSVCKKHNLVLIEDAAQAHGARYKGKRVGSFGQLACFSFYPGKNLGACGEGGAIATNDEKSYQRALHLRNHGSAVRYYHDELGYNMRMGGLEAASLAVKLKYLDEWNNRRREIAGRYHNKIKNPKIKMQYQPGFAESIYHLFVVVADNRDEIIKHLNMNEIFPALHYPVPCHLQKAYHHLGYSKGDCPNAEYLAGHCLSLPIFAELTDDEIERVILALNEY